MVTLLPPGSAKPGDSFGRRRKGDDGVWDDPLLLVRGQDFQNLLSHRLDLETGNVLIRSLGLSKSKTWTK